MLEPPPALLLPASCVGSMTDQCLCNTHMSATTKGCYENTQSMASTKLDVLLHFGLLQLTGCQKVTAATTTNSEIVPLCVSLHMGMTGCDEFPFTGLPACFHTVAVLDMHTHRCPIYQHEHHMHNNMQNEIRRLVCFLVVVLVYAVSPCSAMQKASCCLSPVHTKHGCQTAYQVVGIGQGDGSGVLGNRLSPSCTSKARTLQGDGRSAPSQVFAVLPMPLVCSALRSLHKDHIHWTFNTNAHNWRHSHRLRLHTAKLRSLQMWRPHKQSPPCSAAAVKVHDIVKQG